MNEPVKSETLTSIESRKDDLLGQQPETSRSAKQRIKGVHRFKTYEAFNEWKAHEMTIQPRNEND